MDNGTRITARWPITPLGTSITFETHDTYELVGCASEIGAAIAELRRHTLLGRLIIFLRNIFSK